MDIATVDELLTTTRAVRKRLDLTRPVGRDVILECIQLAMQAPTGSNAQDWRWLVITDADKRAAIADIYGGIRAGADRIMRVIRARCGDVLSDDDLALITQPDGPLGEMIPIAVADQILDVVMTA